MMGDVKRKQILDFLRTELIYKLRHCAKYLAVTSGNEPNIGKKANEFVSGSDLHNSFTYMDRFVQDFITLSILEKFPNMRLLLEEDTGLTKLVEYGDNIGTILIDPIDGTKCFVEGGDDFSTLVCYINQGQVLFSCGIYPMTGQILFAEGHDRKASLHRNGHKTNVKKSNTATVASHYRINSKEFLHFRNALERCGKSLLWNGNGFHTNLTGARMVVEGKAAAMLFPYTAAHDAIAPAHLIMAGGGTVRRYRMEDRWSRFERVEFSFPDLEDGLQSIKGGRVRLIAARDEETADGLEEALSRANDD